MKERPILFSGPMVRAILEGRKTQTRRVVKPQPEYSRKLVSARQLWDVTKGGWNLDHPAVTSADAASECNYGQPGDRLWVRETWRVCGRCVTFPRKSDSPPHINYEANCECWYVTGKERRELEAIESRHAGHKRPSIFMPRWASRITLEITNVKVERLQEISKPDALAEGIEYMPAAREIMESSVWTFSHAFSAGWDSINAKRGYSWQSNPWVWVIEFKRILA